MLEIGHFFWQMCLLRRGPRDLPATTFGTGLVLALYLLIALTVITLTQPDNSPATTLGTVTTGVLLQALITWALLLFKGVRHRFRPVWSALLGTNAVMLLLLLPFNLILLNAENAPLKAFAEAAVWVCLGWWLAIAGNIYSKSLGVGLLLGSAVAFLVELLSLVATPWLLTSTANGF